MFTEALEALPAQAEIEAMMSAMDDMLAATAAISTANENMPLTTGQAQIALEQVYVAKADVRIIDTLKRGVLIHVQSGPAPAGRGVELFSGADRFLLTERAFDAYRAANPALTIVCDF